MPQPLQTGLWDWWAKGGQAPTYNVGLRGERKPPQAWIKVVSKYLPGGWHQGKEPTGSLLASSALRGTKTTSSVQPWLRLYLAKANSGRQECTACLPAAQSSSSEAGSEERGTSHDLSLPSLSLSPSHWRAVGLANL